MEIDSTSPSKLILRRNTFDAVLLLTFATALVGLGILIWEEHTYCAEWHGVLVEHTVKSDSDSTTHTYVVRIGYANVTDPPGSFSSMPWGIGQRLAKRYGDYCVSADYDGVAEKHAEIEHLAPDPRHLLIMLLLLPGFSILVYAWTSRRIILDRKTQKIQVEFAYISDLPRLYEEFHLTSISNVTIGSRTVKDEDAKYLVHDVYLNGVAGARRIHLLTSRSESEAEQVRFAVERFLSIKPATQSSLLKTRSAVNAYPRTGIVLSDVIEAGKAIGTCQVCGTAMTTGVVHCPACSTPHHQECWSYNGKCSTYACRG